MSERTAPPEVVTARREYRIGLFTRRGLPVERAEALADRLTLRDADRDDRRVCAECSKVTADHPKFGRGCADARAGLIRGASRHMSPLMEILQRCERFEFQKPQ